MSNGQNHEEPKKRGLGSKIMWGGLIAGAVVAIAATVAFVFAPETAMQVTQGVKDALTASYESIGKASMWLTDKTIGNQSGNIIGSVQEGITNLYNKIPELTGWIGDKVVCGFSTQAYEASIAAQNNGILTNIDNSSTLVGKLWEGTATASHDVALKASTSGVVGLIMNNKIISLAAAGVAAFGLSKATSGGMSAEEEKVRYEQLRAQREGFAMKEDMRKMQAVMVARAAAAGVPEAQAMQGAART